MSERVRTYCRICEATCGLVAERENGRVLRLYPDEEHPVTRGYACIKGPAMLEVHRDPDRLARPQARAGDSWRDLSWDEATRAIGDRLRAIRRAHGPDSVAVYLGNPSAFSYALSVYTAGFVAGLATRNFYSASSLDCQNKFAVADRMYGSYAIQPIPDLDRTDFFLCLGSNPLVSQMSFVAMPRALERLRAIVARGGRVVNVNPRRTETAQAVGEQLFIRPDSDAFFLMALLRIIFHERLADENVLAKLNGVDELKRAAEPFTVEDAAAATGIAAEKIFEIARAFAGARSANAYCSTGVNQGTDGSLAFFAVQALNAVTGNLDRDGGARVPARALRLAKVARLLDRMRAERPSRVGGFQPVAGTLPTGILADEILTPGEGRIRALIVLAGNPLLSAPGGDRLAEALRSLDLLVSIDLYRNETGALAHYTLPTTDFLERDDFPLVQLGMHPEPYSQYSEAIVAPRDERRGEGRILIDLARATGVPMFRLPGVNWLFRSVLPERIAPWLMRGMGLPVGATRRAGVVRLPDDPAGAFFRAVPTRSGRVEVGPADVLAAAPDAAARMRRDAAIARSGSPPPLRLIGRRQRRSHNSWMHNVAKLRPAGAECRLAIHPDDAARRGLSDGARAQLSSASGRVEVAVELDEELMPGTVSLPHGWGHTPDAGWRAASADGERGVNSNLLAASGPAALEPLSGMVRFNGIEVEVAPAPVQQ